MIVQLTSIIIGPPIINNTHPDNQLITDNMAISLVCEGIGKGPITYHWETSNINGGQWMNISNSNSSRLVVRNLQQSRHYRCVVSNVYGSTRSDVATVTVLSKLFINMVAMSFICDVD